MTGANSGLSRAGRIASSVIRGRFPSSPARMQQLIIPRTQGLTSACCVAISTSPGTVRAFGVGLGLNNDGYDEIERRTGRSPQAAAVSLLAPRHPRDGPDPRPLCRRGDRDAVRRRAGHAGAPDRGARSRSLCGADRRCAAARRSMRARCSIASRRFARWTTTHEIAGQISRRAARTRPRAHLCQCRRGRRRAGRLGSGPRRRGAAESARREPCRGLPRRAADAAAGAIAGILCAGSAGHAVPGLGLPAL